MRLILAILALGLGLNLHAATDPDPHPWERQVATPTVAWEYPEDQLPKVTFRIYFRQIGDPLWLEYLEVPQGAGTRFTVPGLALGQEWELCCVAVEIDGGLMSEPSESISFVQPRPTRPDGLRIISATETVTTVTTSTTTWAATAP